MANNQRHNVWIFKDAVPAFIFMSAYLYGIRGFNDGGIKFLKKRWVAISSTYYPYLIFVVITFYILGNPLSDLLISSGLGFFYLPVVRPLPYSYHLWFIQSMALCYLFISIVGRNSKNAEIIRRWHITVLLIIIMFLIGFIYRGQDVVYITLYILVYCHANHIYILSKKHAILLIVLLTIFYWCLSLNYESEFYYAVYLYKINECIVGLLVLMLFIHYFEKVYLPSILEYISYITMEIYLVHHLFVWDWPLYVSIPLTIISAIILHFIAGKLSVQLKKIANV